MNYDGMWPPPALVGEHRSYVEEWPDDELWDAVCDCGWESTEYEDRDSAESAADQHAGGES